MKVNVRIRPPTMATRINEDPTDENKTKRKKVTILLKFYCHKFGHKTIMDVSDRTKLFYTFFFSFTFFENQSSESMVTIII